MEHIKKGAQVGFGFWVIAFILALVRKKLGLSFDFFILIVSAAVIMTAGFAFLAYLLEIDDNEKYFVLFAGIIYEILVFWNFAKFDYPSAFSAQIRMTKDYIGPVFAIIAAIYLVYRVLQARKEGKHWKKKVELSVVVPLASLWFAKEYIGVLPREYHWVAAGILAIIYGYLYYRTKNMTKSAPT